MESLQPMGAFFSDEDQYIRFLVGLKKLYKVTPDDRVLVILTKEGGYYLCKVMLRDSGMYVGDYVKPFRARQEELEQFNKGVNILVERLSIYMLTNDLQQVPDKPPAFGALTHVP